MSISKTEPVWIMGKPKLEDKRHGLATLKELQQKKYLYPNLDLSGMLDDLEKWII